MALGKKLLLIIKSTFPDSDENNSQSHANDNCLQKLPGAMPRVLICKCHDKMTALIRGVAMRVVISSALLGLLSFGAANLSAWAQTDASRPAAANPSTANSSAGNSLSANPTANPSPANSAERLPAPGKEKLGRLECKLFGHSFDSESVEIRTSRLEQLIFGEEASGTVSDRVEKLISLYPAEELAPPVAKVAPKKTIAKTAPTVSAAAGNTSAANANKNLANRSTSTQHKTSDASKNDSASLSEEEGKELDDYPRITALENAILGKSNEGEPLSGRLNALEAKAFGAPSNLPDFSRRTEALEDYSDKTLHKKRIASAGPLYQKEAPPGISRGNAQARQAGSGSGSKQVLATVANTLLGVTGMGGLGILPAAAMGFVPRLVSGKAPANAALPPPEAEDFTASPFSEEERQAPPDAARPLSKVAWCEKQVFGQTFPTLHLTERLRHLSQELQINSNKSDFELMDDIPELVKAIQSRPKSRPIGQVIEPPVAVR